jgi:hypothetical protein
MSMKNSNDTIWNRTSDHPICNTVPEYQFMLLKIWKERKSKEIRSVKTVLTVPSKGCRIYSPVPSCATPRVMPSGPALCRQNTPPLSTCEVHATSNKETSTHHLRAPCDRCSHKGFWKKKNQTIHHARSNRSHNKDKTCSSRGSFHTFTLNFSSVWYHFIKCSLWLTRELCSHYTALLLLQQTYWLSRLYLFVLWNMIWLGTVINQFAPKQDTN